MTKLDQRLNDLIDQLRLAKIEEQEANQARIAIESEIYALVQPVLKSEGTTSLEGISITENFTYKIDQEAAKSFADSGVVRAKYELDMREYKAIQKHNAALYDAISQHVEVKKGKPSFKLTDK